MLNSKITAWMFLAVLWTACRESKSPYTPEEALKRFRLPDGFRIELVAAEPLVVDPVEIAFDPDGRMYVVEMSDYPADGPPRSRVSLLEDKDGDGKFESGQVFAEDLPFANGVMPWKKGVLVTAAPDIVYLEDSTGDGRADIRRVVLTGFAQTNPQLRVSGLRYGPDNWIYGAYSRAGGARGYPEFADYGRPLRFPGNPANDSADIYPGTDFRFRPDEYKVEPSGGMSQFGLTFDAAGNRFTVWNNAHLRHVVMEQRYVKRNPHLNVSAVMASVPDHGDAAAVYSIAENRLDLHESEIGHFTSACGPVIYTGGLFPENYAHAAFVCEPVSNIVHADRLEADGATFTGKRYKEGEEFLASKDSWFRPVNTTIGPDGALYVVDFYRKLVEHPAWIARADEKGIYTHAGVLQEADFLEGRDKGRIYRIVPDNFKRTAAMKPRLGKADAAALVQYLAHPNMWWRTTAQRLLVQRQDSAAVPALLKMAADTAAAEGRMHALWALEGLKRLDRQLVLEALHDRHPAVRRQAVVLAESRLPDPVMEQQLNSLATDPDNQVQFQVALALSALPPARSFATLQNMAMRHIDDPWFQSAVLLAAAENPLQWFEAVTNHQLQGEKQVQGKAALLQKIASIAGARRNAAEVSRLLSLVRHEKDTAFRLPALAGLGEGLRRTPGKLQLTGQGQDDLLQLVSMPGPAVQNAAIETAAAVKLGNSPAVRAAVGEAAAMVLDGKADPDARAHAVRVLGLDPGGLRIALFEKLLRPQQPVNIQLAAAKVLLNSEDTAATALLIGRWNGYTTEVRSVVEDGLLAKKAQASLLVKALEEKKLEPGMLSRASRNRLAKHSDKDVRQRAEAVFSSLKETKRNEVVQAYHEAATRKGSPEKGKAVFKNNCSTCHRIKDMGHEVGPDLLSLTNRTRIDLLTMILNPNDNIAPGYEAYTIVTTNGGTLGGMMVHESATSVTIRAPGGAEQTVPREQIETVRPMGISLMPDGLEANISTEEMANLLEFLKNPG